MHSRSDAQALLELMRDERFIAIRRASDEEILLRSDLDAFPLPRSLNADETWAILTAVRYQTASLLSWKTYLDIGYETETWYTLTKRMALKLQLVEATCRERSSLDQATTSLSGSMLLVRQVEDDLEAALKMEGTSISREAIHAMFSEARQPSSKTERLVRNFFDVLANIKKIAEHPIDPNMLDEIHNRLVLGTEGLSGKRSRVVPLYEKSEHFDQENSKRSVCQIAAGDNTDPPLHPVLRIISMAWFFRDFNPVPTWCGLVEILIRHIALLQWGYPVLRWIPYRKLSLSYARGETRGTRTHREVYESALNDCGFGLDATALFSSYLDLILAGLDDLRSIVDQTTSIIEHLEKIVSQDAELNHRQRAILSNAFLAPDKAQKIRPHQAMFNVAYATARHDFVNLVERGYLTQEHAGKAFAYRLNRRHLP